MSHNFTPLKTIVFDFDGVLAESVAVKGEAFYDLYREYGPQIQDQVLDYHLGHGGVSRFDKIRYYETELLGRPNPTDQEVDYIAERFSSLVEEKVTQSAWVTGAKEFLEAYHTKIPLYVVSATPQAELERIIEKRDMSRYFKTIYGSPTKKPVHLNTIARENTYAPQDMVMIGDTISDYNAAKDVGTYFIGRLEGDAPTDFPGGTPVINDLTGLPAALEGLSQ